MTSQQGHLLRIRSKIRKGADLNAPCDDDDFSELHLAAFLDHPKVIVELLKNGAEVDLQTAVRFDSSLHLAARLGKVDSVEALLAGKANVNLLNQWMCTPLHKAVYEDQLGVVELLVKSPGIDLSLRNCIGLTALDVARRKSRSNAIIRLLTSTETDDDSDEHPNQARVTRIDDEPSQLKMIRRTAKKGGATELNKLLPDGWSHAHIATYRNHDKALKELILEGADLNLRMQTNMDSPLHTAACWGCIDSMRTLIEEGKVDLNPRDEFGSTPLHYAVDEDKPEAVRMLIKYGADLNLENAMGETVLDMATKFRHTTIEKLLRDARAQQGSGRIWHQTHDPRESNQRVAEGGTPAKRQHVMESNRESQVKPGHKRTQGNQQGEPPIAKDIKASPKKSPNGKMDSHAISPATDKKETLDVLESRVQECVIQKEEAAGEFIKKCLDVDAQDRVIEKMKQSLEVEMQKVRQLRKEKQSLKEKLEVCKEALAKTTAEMNLAKKGKKEDGTPAPPNSG